MRKILFAILLISAFLSNHSTFAEITINNPTRIVHWITKNSAQPITVQNGTGAYLIVVITVDDLEPNSPGIHIKNCGTTTHVDSGSSVICATRDSANPVTFVSDTVNKTASGVYHVEISR
jgi:hypothetical protein